MHKWWARRLGSVFRTILLYSLADDNLEKWDGNPDTLWNLYPNDVSFSDKIVLDPMMGGGTTIMEALRLGCRVIGWDLNPVAWFVVKKQVESINTVQLSDILIQLEKDLGTELRKYYSTTCPHCDNKAEAIYYFYYKELYCHNCGEKIALMPDYFLAKSPVGDGDIVVCPDCWNVFTSKSAKNQTKCEKCGREFVPVDDFQSKRHEYHCMNEDCDSGRIIDWIEENGRPKEIMYALEFYCKYCDESGNSALKHGRGYKAADLGDQRLLKRARKEFSSLKDQLPIPSTDIPRGVETQRALNHGYVRFSDMFNERQLLNLGKIYRWIMEIEDWNLKEFLALAFSNSLKYNTMFAKYNSTHGFITDIFRTHSFSPSMAPVETNCYDTAKGRGSFTAFVRLVIEGKEYCQRPFERVIKDEKWVKIYQNSPIHGKIIDNFSQFSQKSDIFLQCGSSESMSLPDGTVDVVVTDPPYADNVMYSELSNFFYVWLRLLLQEKYDHFSNELVPWEKEVIANKVQEKGKKEFLDGLTQVFRESNRVMKDDGILVFTFHHKSPETWGVLLQAVLDSGFFMSVAHPVRSEMKSSTHLYRMSNMTIDMVFVCRKRLQIPLPRTWESVKQELISTFKELVTKYDRTENGRPDLLAMGLGKCLAIYSQGYPNILRDDNLVNIDEVIDTILEIVENELDITC